MTRVISAPSFLIAVGAGLASALLFASLVGGSMLALPLFFLTPLPLGIAALGWGTAAGLVAGVVTAAAVGIGLGLPAMLAVALAHVAPTLIAAHLLGLARLLDPADATAPREWYPIGRVLAAVTLVVAATTVIGGIAAGFDPAEISAQVTTGYRELMVQDGVGAAPGQASSQVEPVVHAMVRLMPAMIGAFGVLVIVFDLWAAARVVRMSGRLARPVDDLASVELPVSAGLVLAAALALSFVDGTPGLIAGVIAGALFSAHFLVGLGVLHTLARRTEARIIILAFVYGLMMLFTIPAALVALAGLLEPHIGLRRRLPPPGSA